MTSFVDHMKNITVPSMIQDVNEMNHYWAMLTRIPGSGVSAQPNMDVVTTSHEEKLFPLDNGWYLRRETPVKGFTKKWPDPNQRTQRMAHRRSGRYATTVERWERQRIEEKAA